MKTGGEYGQTVDLSDYRKRIQEKLYEADAIMQELMDLPCVRKDDFQTVGCADERILDVAGWFDEPLNAEYDGFCGW